MLLDLYSKLLARVKGWSEGFYESILDRILTVNGILELD